MLPFHYLNCSLKGIWGMVWGQDSVGEADGWTLWSWSLLQPQWFYDSFWRSTCCITGRTSMYLHLSSSFEEWLRHFFGSHICSHFSFNLPHSHVTVLKEKAYKHRFAMFWVGFFFFSPGYFIVICGKEGKEPKEAQLKCWTYFCWNTAFGTRPLFSNWAFKVLYLQQVG